MLNTDFILRLITDAQAQPEHSAPRKAAERRGPDPLELAFAALQGAAAQTQVALA